LIPPVTCPAGPTALPELLKKVVQDVAVRGEQFQAHEGVLGNHVLHQRISAEE
jgi:hypothetical protein